MMSDDMRRNLALIILALAVVLLASCPNPTGSGSSVRAVILKADVDGYVDDSPAEDFGSALMYVNEDELDGDDSVILIQFDSSDLPTGKVIIAASLKILCVSGPEFLDTITVYGVNQTWDEGIVDYAAASAGPFVDTKTEPVARDVTSQDTGNILSWSIKEIVQKWATDGGNYGLILKSTSVDPGGQTEFSATEGDKKPKLEIWYK